MLEAPAEMLAEHARVEQELADPAVHGDQAKARALGKRYAELTPVVDTHRELQELAGDLATARELAVDDESFRAEVPVMEARQAELEARLRTLLLPRDENDGKDVILEIKAGEGGEESALFAGDLLRMYLRYAERVGWKTEVIEATETDMGGYKDVQLAVKSRGTPAPGEGVWSRLKYEGGVHRVQRVPVTESQGRIHTSAAGVLVLPEAEEVDVEIDPNDLRVDVYRSSGPGGQSVNTTDSAVRITHLPTGIVVSQQDQKSQLQNKIKAMEVLRARLLDRMIAERDAERARMRRTQVSTGDRSAKIRTYNFPQSRVTDHRIGLTLYKLDKVLAGELDDVSDALVADDQAHRLAEAT